MKEQRPNRRDVERVRELLNEAAPQDTRASYRAESVVRRGRRARTGRGVASALAVGVAAAAVIIGPAFIDSSPVTSSGTDPSNGVAAEPTYTPPTNTPPLNEPMVSYPEPYQAHPCAVAPVDLSELSDAVATLEPDAAMVRLCRAGGPGFSSAWDPPADALVTGVDGFAAQVADLPAADPDPCPAMRPVPQPFALQITDSAGATQTLGSALTACGVVTINSRLISAEALLATFGEALAEQRTTLEPAVADTTLECQGNPPRVRPGWMSEVTAQTRFIAAITCRPFGDPVNDSHYEAKPAPASDAAIDLLNEEWAANARDLRTHEPLDVDRCPAFGLIIGPTYVMTTWGDVVRMRMAACGDYRIGSFQLLLSERLVKEMSLPYQPGLHWTVPGN